MPPAAFRSSAAIFIPSSVGLPNMATSPVSAPRKPILMVSEAALGASAFGASSFFLQPAVTDRANTAVKNSAALFLKFMTFLLYWVWLLFTRLFQALKNFVG